MAEAPLSRAAHRGPGDGTRPCKAMQDFFLGWDFATKDEIRNAPCDVVGPRPTAHGPLPTAHGARASTPPSSHQAPRPCPASSCLPACLPAYYSTYSERAIAIHTIAPGPARQPCSSGSIRGSAPPVRPSGAKEKGPPVCRSTCLGSTIAPVGRRDAERARPGKCELRGKEKGVRAARSVIVSTGLLLVDSSAAANVDLT